MARPSHAPFEQMANLQGRIETRLFGIWNWELGTISKFQVRAQNDE